MKKLFILVPAILFILGCKVEDPTPISTPIQVRIKYLPGYDFRYHLDIITLERFEKVDLSAEAKYFVVTSHKWGEGEPSDNNIDLYKGLLRQSTELYLNHEGYVVERPWWNPGEYFATEKKWVVKCYCAPIPDGAMITG